MDRTRPYDYLLFSLVMALLAAVLPNPRRWSASEPTRYIQRRAGVITRRVGQLGPATACAAPPA